MGRSRAKSMIHLPASFSRRRPRFGRDSRGNPSSGAEMAPERGLRTPRPRKRALRREAPAATTRGDTHSCPVSVGARAGVGRRGARASGASAFPCGRGNAPSGEKSTPEGSLWTGLLREPVSRRVFLAGGSLWDPLDDSWKPLCANNTDSYSALLVRPRPWLPW